nr:MAG TPA: PVL ORF-50-like family [Caudoviricetes sp.]
MREYTTEDLTGRKFGMLMVIKRDVGNDYITPSTGRKSARWICKCDCGNIRSVPVQQLRSGHTWNCGCQSKNKFKDLTGQKFGKLTIIERAEDYITPRNEREVQWKCKCDCGRECIVRGHSLRNGHTTSCGCAIIEASTKHGMHGTRLYNIYRHMIQRCHNETDKAYKDYGARGIYVCDEWRGENGFINFMNWAFANGYTDELSIDRKDNDGPYSPENCRWVTMAVQANNRRNTIYITYNGEMHSISEWAIIYNIPYATLYDRYVNKHWTAEQALITPVGNNIHLVSNSFGETHTIEEWSRITGINYKTLYNRVFIDRLSIDQAISIPVNPIAVPKYITYEGTKMCYSDWERARGFSSGVISYRMKQGMTANEALNTPVKDNKGNDKPINAIYFVDNNGKPI